MNTYIMWLTSIKPGVTVQVTPEVTRQVQACFQRTFEQEKSIKAAQDAVIEGLRLTDGMSVRFDPITEGPSTPTEQVEEFHRVFGHPVNDKPTLIDRDRWEMRLKLIEEEAKEMRDALELLPEGTEEDVQAKLVAVADALGDLEYVVQGAALEFGIPLNPVVEEIHLSNMTKLGKDGKPIYRADKKVLKGENFVPPNLDAVLFPDQ